MSTASALTRSHHPQVSVNRFPGVDAIVLDGGMTLAGVLKPPKAAS
jgi:hypothetical protein